MKIATTRADHQHALRQHLADPRRALTALAARALGRGDHEVATLARWLQEAA